MADEEQIALENWSEDQVRDWLRSIGLKDKYVQRLYDEKVNGKTLLELDEDFLSRKMCKAQDKAPSFLIISKRDELIKRQQVKQNEISASDSQNEVKKKANKTKSQNSPPTTGQPELVHGPNQGAQSQQTPADKSNTKDDCKPRPFDQEALDFIYVKNRVLLPESGAFDLITPCHEYKSFASAATLDRTRLQAKFACEVLKFATGCINIRTNGTIHFGVMDSQGDSGYVHGEIIGVPVTEKDMYVDALDYVEKSFSSDNKDQIRQCMRPPRFVEVIDPKGTEKKYVVEVDIVPKISIVKNEVYSVRLPKFNESSNKVKLEKETIYRRMGSKTEPVNDTDTKHFYEGIKNRDAQREDAEKSHFYNAPSICKDLGRKLTMLMTDGKKFIDKDKWFILVTNKISPADLGNIDWLFNLNIFCVFDFDPDSKVSGLCNTFLQHHLANMHSLQSYRLPTGMAVKELESRLHLFEQTSWIFSNGRSDYNGNDNPCDEMTWIKSKMTLLSESVSLICKHIFPKGAFQVIFLITSEVEKPLLHTFHEFYRDMEGHEDIICICESEKNFLKWQAFAESYGKEAVDNHSVVGLKMSHVDTILQQVQPVKTVDKLLPVVNGTCTLVTQEEERMYSLEILSVNHCDETNVDFIDEKKEEIEQQFYRGGRVEWMNFWLADQGYVGEVIERDTYGKASKLLNDNLKYSPSQDPVVTININHHPGSGGSTVARLLLWNQRKTLRCAVVKSDQTVADVSQHAVELREYEEKDPQRCLPLLLLIEDSDEDYLGDLRKELEVAMIKKKIQNGKPCFILLSCRRSHDPERKTKEPPLQNVSVTHRLSKEEKRKFAAKRDILEQQYQPDFILTFVLMSEGFSEEYIRKFVTNILEGIDSKSVVTRLMHYVALLNTYVQNSYISQSHCEALLSMTLNVERSKFEKYLSDQAKLVFLHLKDDKTHIESIRIIHPLVAKEILEQLLDKQMNQSKLAMNLLGESVLFEHRFGRYEYQTFLRDLFIRRSKKSKGDTSDTLFAPLIEYVCEHEGGPDPAIALLEEAFTRFRENAFIAQHLARFHYKYARFEVAKHWAEVAAEKQPNNSYILDTKGQVYKRWFQAKCKVIDDSKDPKTVDSVADAVETALKAIECFQDCERAAEADMEHLNNNGYFAEVEVGCSLLKLIQSLPMFSTPHGRSELTKFLLTDYIPLEIHDSWKPFHDRLKKLHKAMQDSLEWISEDLSYFQTEIEADEEKTPGSHEEKISHPLKWLTKRSSEFGNLFSGIDFQPNQQIPDNLTPFQKQMIIYRLGGGNITSIIFKLTDKKNGVEILKTIISLYPSNPLQAKLRQNHIICYILAHITLNCLSSQTQSPSMRDLQALCQRFRHDNRKCSPGALFLLTLLFWPDDHDSDTEKEAKYETVQSAVEELKKRYWTKTKEIKTGNRRLYTHFFLGKGKGLDKFVHKMKFGELGNASRSKWWSGEVLKRPETAVILKQVSGWTEDGIVYLAGPKKRKFSLLPLHAPSVPHSNENITFYLGFTFRGLVACNISKK